MNELDIKNIQIGDRVRFKAATRHSFTEAERVVTGKTMSGRIRVSYHGWTGFVLKNREIISHSPKTDNVFEVIVGNIGTVYDGNNYMQAQGKYSHYVRQSKGGWGRAAGESVTLFHHGEIRQEFFGTQDPFLAIDQGEDLATTEWCDVCGEDCECEVTE